MTDGLLRRGEAAILPTYPERPLGLVRGAGCTVWDEAGTPYLDLVAGLDTIAGASQATDIDRHEGEAEH